jgi:hypothetical protein
MSETVQQTVTVGGLTINAGTPILTLAERIRDLMAELADAKELADAEGSRAVELIRQRRALRASTDRLINDLEWAVLARSKGLPGSSERLHAAKQAIRDAHGVAPAAPTDEEVAAWADSFIREHAYNRPVAVQIAVEAAKWVRSRIAGVSASRSEAPRPNPSEADR